MTERERERREGGREGGRDSERKRTFLLPGTDCHVSHVSINESHVSHGSI